MEPHPPQVPGSVEVADLRGPTWWAESLVGESGQGEGSGGAGPLLGAGAG